MFDPDDLDDTYLTGIVAMGTGTGLDITGNFYHPDISSRRYSSLVEGKTIFLFGSRPVLYGDLNRQAFHDHPVRLYLNLPEFFGSDVFEVSYIDPGTVTSFLRSCLVNVSSKDLLCGMEEDVGSRVVAHQGPSPLFIDHPFYPFATV